MLDTGQKFSGGWAHGQPEKGRIAHGDPIREPGTSRPLEVSGPSGFPFIIGCPYENRQFMKPVGNTSFLRLFQGPTGGCPTLATRRPGAIDRLLPILLRF